VAPARVAHPANPLVPDTDVLTRGGTPAAFWPAACGPSRRVAARASRFPHWMAAVTAPLCTPVRLCVVTPPSGIVHALQSNIIIDGDRSRMGLTVLVGAGWARAAGGGCDSNPAHATV
jgi:hypothetical protein